jgi:DedD protein
VHAQDDAFHEIQLNSKQLVFVFMVATVASVVIFLCGVFVGRGVRAERGGTEEAAVMTEAPAADVAPPRSPAGGALVPKGADPTAAAPPPTVDDQSYVARLEKRNPPAEDLKPVPPSPSKPPSGPPAETKASSGPPPLTERKATALPPSTESRPNAPPLAPASKSPPAAEAASPPATQAASPGQGYMVQVAALNVRSEADAIAKRLVSKGYTAFVQAPTGGTPAVFRVRVGPFTTRLEADTMAAKLQREEQFKPWVTR